MGLVMTDMTDIKAVKCCLVGDFGVGKTSLAHVWLDEHKTKVQTTLGIDFFSKIMSMGSQVYHLKIWDTAGAERFHSLTHTYLRDSDVVVVVYDRSRERSNLDKWMRMVEQATPAVVGVVGNKCDLPRVNSENMDEMLAPWSREVFSVVQGTCSTCEPPSCKAFLKQCLRLLEKNPAPAAERVDLAPSITETHLCCA